MSTTHIPKFTSRRFFLARTSSRNNIRGFDIYSERRRRFKIYFMPFNYIKMSSIFNFRNIVESSILYMFSKVRVLNVFTQSMCWICLLVFQLIKQTTLTKPFCQFMCKRKFTQTNQNK